MKGYLIFVGKINKNINLFTKKCGGRNIMKQMKMIMFFMVITVFSANLFSQVDTLLAYDMKIQSYSDTSVLIYPNYMYKPVNRPEEEQVTSLSVVSNPSHGSVDLLSSYRGSFVYTPNNVFSGQDQFTFKITVNGLESNTATCRLLVRKINEHAGELVIIVVNNAIAADLSSDLNRLAADLRQEGYTAKITARPSDSSRGLWNYLKSEYDSVNQFLAGAILVGNMPKANVTVGTTTTHTDLVYWNMQTYGNTYSRHIWVSRISANNKYGNPGVWGGSDTSMIRRYLQTNHDYRTGISRYPHIAYHYDDLKDGWGGKIQNALQVWPEVKYLDHVSYCFRAGGDIIHETAHGHEGEYDYYGVYPRVRVHTKMIYDYLAQVRYVLNTSCSSGELAGVVNNQIFTRRGGNILSVGLSATGYTGALIILDSNYTDSCFRAQLKRGNSWGSSLVNFYPFMDYQRPIFYGDLSLPVKLFPSNVMPIIDTLIADKKTGVAPLTVNFIVNAHDSDGNVALYEWYAEGHNYGRWEPKYTQATAIAQSHTYTLPHRYQARVQVVDNYQAVAWKEVEIVVGPQSNTALRVNCGYTSTGDQDKSDFFRPGDDYLDKDNALWLHDQGFTSGTWGCSSNSSMGTSNYAVNGTEDDTLYNRYRYCLDSRYPPLTYKIPLIPGSYTLNLGFADMQSNGVGQRVMNVVVNGDTIQKGLDVYALAGPKTVYVLSTPFTVADSGLVFSLAKDSVGTAYPFINCFEVIPASVSVESKILTRQHASVYPNPFNEMATISYGMPEKGKVCIRVFDINGHLVRSLYSGKQSVGSHFIAWNGRNQQGKAAAIGVYYIRVELPGKTYNKKLLLIK
jgi:hypothetical protein